MTWNYWIIMMASNLIGSGFTILMTAWIAVWFLQGVYKTNLQKASRRRRVSNGEACVLIGLTASKYVGGVLVVVMICMAMVTTSQSFLSVAL